MIFIGVSQRSSEFSPKISLNTFCQLFVRLSSEDTPRSVIKLRIQVAHHAGAKEGEITRHDFIQMLSHRQQQWEKASQVLH